MGVGYSPKLPLQHDSIDGYYKLNKTLGEVIKQNIKMVVLTAPGERMWDPDFGVGLRNYLFEQDSSLFASIRKKIEDQLSKYVPYAKIMDIRLVKLQEIPGEPEPTNSMGLQLIYASATGQNDSLTIAFKN